MKYRKFPRADVEVSEVGFGTWTLSTGWWGEKTDDEAVAMLRRAYDDFGINFFDAADSYGNGRSEKQLATAFKGMRDKVVIGTKVGYDIYDEGAARARRGQMELPQRTDPAYIRMAVDRCLQRLETDYIDVLQIHNVKMTHVHDRALWQTLRDLKREGKIRAWGAAFGPAIGWLYEATDLVEREPDIDTIQMIWNILEQHPGTAMIEAAVKHSPSCCFNIRVTHASGMLEGKYTENTEFAANDHRRHRPRSWLVNGVKKVATLGFLQERMTLGQASLKWLLAEPRVVTTLPNVYDDEQLREFAATSELPDLTDAEMERIESLHARNFGVDEEPMSYKGEMVREGGAYNRVYPPNAKPQPAAAAGGAATGAGTARRARMINAWHDIPPGSNPPELVTAVIEIPRGSRNKYELDKETGLMKLDRVLYSAVHYPGDYGFIPRTLFEDGDPLDVLVRINEPTFPGCQIEVRPIGVLKMLDKGQPDDKILAVPAADPFHNEYFDIADLPQHYLAEIEHFFHIYKDLEGKRVTILGWEKSGYAMETIMRSIALYEKTYFTPGT